MGNEIIWYNFVEVTGQAFLKSYKNLVIAGSTRNPMNNAKNPRDCGSEAAMTLEEELSK